MIAEFRKWLIKQNLSENTVNSYTFTVEHYFSIYKEVNKENLLTYKGFLVETYKGKTVNLRIQGLNKYLEYIGQTSDRLKFVKIQQKNFLENVISNADYVFFKNQLKKDKNMDWYFVVRFLGATGARVSELIEIKVEHVKIGHVDIYSKGGKIRRLYIAKSLQREALKWLKSKNPSFGINDIDSYFQNHSNDTQENIDRIKDEYIRQTKSYTFNPNMPYFQSFGRIIEKKIAEQNSNTSINQEKIPNK